MGLSILSVLIMLPEKPFSIFVYIIIIVHGIAWIGSGIVTTIQMLRGKW